LVKQLLQLTFTNTVYQMVTANDIVAHADEIVRRFKPSRIVLFGSYACGQPSSDSDVDLFITRHRWADSPLTVAGQIRIALGVPFPMDLIVSTEGGVARRLAWKDAFLLEIMQKGITLYAAGDEGVGRQGRIRLRRRLRSVALAQEVTAR
jgi:hypothetical protein